MKCVDGSIYDWPKYYDFVYASDWRAEVEFIEKAARDYARGPVESYFEPACGTGRLLYQLARRGHSVGGIDINLRSIEFCNRRLSSHGLKAAARLGDMREFKLPRPVDVGFNTINSFRHLTTDQDALAHLQCMARAIRPGGLYLLGLHLSPTEGEPDESESWTQRRGHLQINAHMWLEARNPRKRLETFAMAFDVYTPKHQFRIRDRIEFRSYTRRQILSLFKRVPRFEIVELFDFAYDDPIELNDGTQDAIFVLRRRNARRKRNGP